MVAQAWTDWLLIAPFAQPYPAAGLAHVQGLLGLAGRLNPDNPHLVAAQQTVTTNTPPAPPQPKQPPVPHTVPFLPGYYVVPQSPAQPDTTPSTDSRQLSSVYQLNPLLPNPTGQPAQPGNGTTIIQVHPRPGTGVPPVSRGTMPTYRQVPPPNGPTGQPTLHTYRAGGPSGSPAGTPPQMPTIRGIHPPSLQQTPPGGSSSLVPQRNSPPGNNQGGQ